jgi:hypothetical protein
MWILHKDKYYKELSNWMFADGHYCTLHLLFSVWANIGIKDCSGLLSSCSAALTKQDLVRPWIKYRVESDSNGVDHLLVCETYEF